MTLRRSVRTIACGIVTLWAALMLLSIVPGTNRHHSVITQAETKTKSNHAKIFGPKLTKVKQIEKHKTNETLSARSGGFNDEISFGSWMDFIATAYDGQDDGMNGTASGLTSTGTRPREWATAAVDPSVIPYGTELDVQLPNGSHAYLRAEDTGGAIRGNRIDIFIRSREQCLEFGREHVLVRIISRK